jgi:hypothetical protein
LKDKGRLRYDRYPIVAVFFFAAVLAMLPEEGAGGADAAPRNIQETLAGGFSLDLRALVYGVIQEYSDSTQNSSNNFLQIPRYILNTELRPDLRLDMAPLSLSAKPRARLYYRAWQEGCREGDSQWDSDLFINEWLARWGVREDLFASYGRENLQWGPSFLFSPSNPFFRDNGRRNPYLEVPGMGFGRAVWIPQSSWTISLIINTDAGLNKPTGPGRFLSSFPPPPFEKTYSVKIDYTGQENYGSVILSRREDSGTIVGFFGGWTLSDAALLYGEGSLTRGSPALYPEADGSPFGASMRPFHKDDSAIDPVLLVGNSYTFETKGTLTFEYAYYSPGLSKREAERYYFLRAEAAQAASSGGPLSALGQAVLGQMVATGLRLLRRNYALVQYTQSNIRDAVDLTLRWTQNLDDGSGQFTSVLVCYLGKHLELFSVASVMAGGKNTEFGSILDYQWMAGLKYTF